MNRMSNLERQAERDRQARQRLGLAARPQPGQPVETRRRIGRPAGTVKPVSHGTEGGYRTEMRRYGQSCDACLAAVRDANNRRYAANRQQYRRTARRYRRHRRAAGYA